MYFTNSSLKHALSFINNTNQEWYHSEGKAQYVTQVICMKLLEYDEIVWVTPIRFRRIPTISHKLLVYKQRYSFRVSRGPYQALVRRLGTDQAGLNWCQANK